MLDDMRETLQFLLGPLPERDDPNAFQIGLRTAIVYAVTLLIVRLGNIRFLSKASAFDVVVGIMLGSIMSRAVNGSAHLVPTIAAGAVLVGLHSLFAWVAYHTDWFGPAIKGDRILLIKDGEIQQKGMEEASITHRDLTEALRLQTSQTNPARIKLAYLERSGQISVIPYRNKARHRRSGNGDRPFGSSRNRTSRDQDPPDHGQNR